MCDPVTLATTAAVTAAGTTLYQGQVANKTAKAQSAADIEQGRAEVLASQERAARMRADGQRFLAEQRVAWNTSGVEGSTGSALEVGKADAAEIELDAMTEIYGGQNRKKALEQQAAFTRAAGKAAVTASYMNAASDILGASKTWESLGGGAPTSRGTSSSAIAGPSSGGSGRSGGLAGLKLKR